MGNSQTKESRHGNAASYPRPNTAHSSIPSPRHESGSDAVSSDRPNGPVYASRGGRGSRPDLSFLGLGGNNDRDVSSLETRRETKQEKEARKLEKERAARLKERERSMKEEHVEGGYLVTQGVYVGVEDYNKSVIDRKLAPFWRGLNDFSESWAEHQLVAAARGLPIPPPDQVPPELDYRSGPKSKDDPKVPEKSMKNLTVPISSRSQSFNSDSSTNFSPSYPAFSLPSPSSPFASSSPSTPLFRTRAKTLAALTTSSRNSSQNDMTPREIQLPKDPFVNGQPIEVYLYKDASECPICFLYYPPYLNTTRCCEQPICSECFVQIKRPDPHPPEHETPDPNAPPVSEAERQAMAEGQLVSEPATCPFCKQPEFGITYTPPQFRKGLVYASNAQPPANLSSAMSSQTSLSSGGLSPGGATRRRATSLSVTAPGVITTDKVRPDWATKLASARAHAARRSAAATALHTAAYLMGGSNQGQDNRGLSGFGRRSMLRRPTGDSTDSPGSPSPHLNALAFLAERNARNRDDSSQTAQGGQSSAFLPPPRGSSSRRSRVDDLEDMMMMEAIRLSLVAEEDRRKKEEKEAKKEAKKKDKENKKAEKAAKKSGLYQATNVSGSFDNASTSFGRSPSATSLQGNDAVVGKGKNIDRSGVQALSTDTNEGLSTMDASLQAGTTEGSNMSPSEPLKRSHLRQISNASSSASSLGNPNTSQDASSGNGNGLESMFNFRSLAAMIGDEEKSEDSGHFENTDSSRPSDAAKDGRADASPESSKVHLDIEQKHDHDVHENAPKVGELHTVSSEVL
ncbi:MAG: hypothetical protein Q9227_007412 [Pyrenula ochraceoflavens]